MKVTAPIIGESRNENPFILRADDPRGDKRPACQPGGNEQPVSQFTSEAACDYENAYVVSADDPRSDKRPACQPRGNEQPVSQFTSEAACDYENAYVVSADDPR